MPLSHLQRPASFQRNYIFTQHIFFLADEMEEEERKFPSSQRNINIKVFSLEVVQRRAPYVHRQTRGLVPSLCVPVLLLPLIPPSPPSHLLHHLCSCNNQDSSCAPSSPPDSGSALSPGKKNKIIPCTTLWLTCSEPHNAAATQTDWLGCFSSHITLRREDTTQLSSFTESLL